MNENSTNLLSQGTRGGVNLIAGHKDLVGLIEFSDPRLQLICSVTKATVLSPLWVPVKDNVDPGMV